MENGLQNAYEKCAISNHLCKGKMEDVTKTHLEPSYIEVFTSPDLECHAYLPARFAFCVVKDTRITIYTVDEQLHLLTSV